MEEVFPVQARGYAATGHSESQRCAGDSGQPGSPGAPNAPGPTSRAEKRPALKVRSGWDPRGSAGPWCSKPHRLPWRPTPLAGAALGTARGVGGETESGDAPGSPNPRRINKRTRAGSVLSSRSGNAAVFAPRWANRRGSCQPPPAAGLGPRGPPAAPSLPGCPGHGVRVAAWRPRLASAGKGMGKRAEEGASVPRPRVCSRMSFPSRGTPEQTAASPQALPWKRAGMRRRWHAGVDAAPGSKGQP